MAGRSRQADRIPRIIGLTGGIGSGKSTVAEIFRSLNCPVYKADDAGRRLMREDAKVKKAVAGEFGGEIYDEHGNLNSENLAALVFGDKAQLAALNAIVHPAVQKDFKQWLAHQNAPVVVKEAAILIESGTYENTDVLVVVTAPEEMRIKRVVERDKSDEKSVRARMANQMPQSKKEEYADFLIVNGERQAVIPQAVEVFNHIGRAEAG